MQPDPQYPHHGIIISGFYEQTVSPLSPYQQSEPPNILAAIASWEEKISKYYGDYERSPALLPKPPQCLIYKPQAALSRTKGDRDRIPSSLSKEPRFSPADKHKGKQPTDDQPHCAATPPPSLE